MKKEIRGEEVHVPARSGKAISSFEINTSGRHCCGTTEIVCSVAESRVRDRTCVAVGIVRRRERKHFFTIAYHDASGTPQTAVFEVPKHDPRGLLAIMRARAPAGMQSRCVLRWFYRTVAAQYVTPPDGK
jgi:hypothetical protein